jgi:hypothetical protein
MFSRSALFALPPPWTDMAFPLAPGEGAATTGRLITSLHGRLELDFQEVQLVPDSG